MKIRSRKEPVSCIRLFLFVSFSAADPSCFFEDVVDGESVHGLLFRNLFNRNSVRMHLQDQIITLFGAFFGSAFNPVIRQNLLYAWIRFVDEIFYPLCRNPLYGKRCDGSCYFFFLQSFEPAVDVIHSRCAQVIFQHLTCGRICFSVFVLRL